MKYFLDTEFIEGTQKTWLGKTKPTIDLISIGLVAEDGREYYAISRDFNLKEAWNRYDIKKLEGTYNPTNTNTGYTQKVYWIRDNVLLPIYLDKIHGDVRNLLPFKYSTMEWVINRYGKTNKQIAKEVKDFVYKDPSSNVNTKHEFYGYFCDYDWVVFCWLFGKMIDLPKGFPMYCKDLKQMLDEKQSNLYGTSKTSEGKLINDIKRLPKYPKQTDAHNALSDAKWNFELYKFLDAI